MPTPVYLTNWSHRVAPIVNGGGLYGVLSGTGMSIDTTILTPQSLKCTVSAAASYVGYTQVVGSGIAVGRVYVYFPTSLPSTSFQFIVTNAASTGTFGAIEYVQSTNKFQARQTGGSSNGTPAVSSVTPAANTLYRFDFRFIWNASGTNSIDWQIDGVSQPQFSVSGQTDTTFNNIRFGSIASATGTVLFQHLILSVTSADYPIGPGTTELLIPTSDGTHNAGTNVMEDNTGADIGVTPAYNKINTLPPSTTPYIQQVAAGTNYAEVLFGNITGSPGTILGAVASLGYTSATTTANRGACIVSKDSFSSYTTVWGNPTTTADYSDGSTASPFWKSAVISGATDVTTVNALAARLGYSGDVNPVPYWQALFVEVAYTVSSGPQTFNQSAGGTLGLSGVVSKRTSKPTSGSLGLSGIISRLTKRPLGGSISPSGSISFRRIYSVILSGTLGLSGVITRKTSRALSGALTPVGVLTRRISKSFSGSISPSGSLSTRNVFTKVISGVLNLSGEIQKTTKKTVSGSLSLSGEVTRMTKKVLSGSLGLSGSLMRISVFIVNISGTLNLSGGVTKRTAKSLSGVLGFSGGLVRKTFKMVSGALTLSGETIASMGSHVYTVFISGTLNLSGEIQKTTKKNVSGLLNSTGSLAKMVSKSVGGLLHFIGTLLPFKPVSTFKTPHVRIYAISEELRIYSIIEPDRLTALLEEIKCYAIEQEFRVASIDDESRTYPIGG